ncbi:MAG TPA: lectin [Streptosporangiaceae bacterium]|nr:lectin [Streptosporangiaceae bacterium]
MAAAARVRLAAIAGSAALLAAALAGSSATADPAAVPLVTDPAALVNPFIGTAGTGNDFPGADAPFGMLQWSPDTVSRPDGGGYSYDDSAITGFSLTHLSGPGCRAAGDIPVLPVTGTGPAPAAEAFSHASESAAAGYYRVRLGNGISAELTATTRTGMARFRFPAGAAAGLVLRLAGSQRNDPATSFRVLSRTEVAGSATSGNFCGSGTSYTVYFDLQFSRPLSSSASYARTADEDADDDAAGPAGLEVTGPGAARLTFAASGAPLLVKAGISYVSAAGARQNLAAEDPGWNFARTRAGTRAAWNALLSQIRVGGGSRDQQAVFYTALYHSLLHPNVFSDVSGRYMGADGAVHGVDPGHAAFYTNFSGWDIYRAQAQLEAVVAPGAASDTAQSMLDDYAQGGSLPKWTQNNAESYVMVGDPADPVLAGYYAFGARHFDTGTALADMIAEATRPGPARPGLGYLDSLGYLPVDGSYGCCNYYEPVATTLEYDTADFAISALAGALGQRQVQARFRDRAQDWRSLLNPVSGLDQRREADGSWAPGFDPRATTGFVEADSLVYTGMVPFNLAGLTRAKGGRAAMAAYLDAALSSFTGAHGAAWLGNEPSLELPWEYDYIGQPARTQQAVREIQDQLWTDTPAGAGDGNDDLGGLSAWYVWSALGLYPVTPGTADLALGSPAFPRVVISRPAGRALVILGAGAAPAAPYVQAATWDGRSWDRAYAPGRALAGGTLRFTLGVSPAPDWAAAPSAAPPSYGPLGPSRGHPLAGAPARHLAAAGAGLPAGQAVPSPDKN